MSTPEQPPHAVPPPPALRALFFVTHFAPESRASANRITRFVRLLPRHGIQPAVVTVEERCIHPRDPLSLRELPAELVVSRAPCCNPGTHLLFSRAAMEQRGGLAHLAWQVGWTGIRIYSRLAFPDTQLFWCVRALPALLRLIRRQRPGVLVASIPPYSPALVAALVARASGIPLVVDYRDAWTQVLQAQHALGPKLRLSRAAERWVAASAAQLTAVTAQHAQVVARDVGAAHAGKLSVVPNALDFASWSTEGAATAAGQPAWAPGQPFTMIYAGGIYGQRSLQPLFAALGRLRRQGTVAAGAGQVRLLVYGAQSPRQLELARQEGVADQLSYSAGVPRSELLQHLSRAQLALAIQGEEYGHGLPSKVLEAIALGKPVLAISPPGSFLAGFLQDCGMGWSFGFDEVERIAELLQRLLQGSEPLSCLPRPGSLDRYQAERTVADFAAVLRRAAGGAPGG